MQDSAPGMTVCETRPLQRVYLWLIADIRFIKSQHGARPDFFRSRPVSFPLVAVGALLAVFGLLAGRAAAVRPGDVLFLFGLGLHLAGLVVAFRRLAEHESAAGYYLVDVHGKDFYLRILSFEF